MTIQHTILFWKARCKEQGFKTHSDYMAQLLLLYYFLFHTHTIKQLIRLLTIMHSNFFFFKHMKQATKDIIKHFYNTTILFMPRKQSLAKLGRRNLCWYRHHDPVTLELLPSEGQWIWKIRWGVSFKEERVCTPLDLSLPMRTLHTSWKFEG